MSEVITETNVDTSPLSTPQSIDDLKPKMKIKGTVTRLELYGAFIDIGVGVNALIHISQLGKERVNRVGDVLSVGDEVTVWVSKVDPQRQQIMVTMIEPLAVEWSDLKDGQVYTGRVTRLENFGAFVDIGAEREGLVHISELSHDFIKHPSEMLKVGDETEVKVLGFSKRKRRIDLSIKALMEKPEPEVPSVASTESKDGKKRKRSRKRKSTETVRAYEDSENDVLPTAMEIALRRAMGDEEIDALAKSERRKKGKRRRKKQRTQQDDIINRTLQLQPDQ